MRIREGSVSASAAAASSGRGATSRVLRLVLVMAAGWLPAIAWSDHVSRAANLVALASEPRPYFQYSHAFLLYLQVPLVTSSACLAVMTPGLLLALAWGGGFHGWVVRGFALTLPVVSAGAILAQTGLGVPIAGSLFLFLLGALSVPCALWSAQRLSGGRSNWPLTDVSPVTIVLLLAVPAVLCAALAPKFLWESFNGDGGHAFLTAKLATRRALPFWDPQAGELSNFPGMGTFSFAYPESWFLRLFGPVEAAVRLPYLLVLAVTQAAIVAIVSQGRARAATVATEALIWLALIVYTVVQAYSSTYDPYSADLSMPGLPDTLQVLAFLGFLQAYLDRRWGWTAWFLALTLTSSPAGLLLVCFWLAAIAVTAGRREWPSTLRGFITLLIVMVGVNLVPVVLRRLGLQEPGSEHGLVNLLGRFAFLQFTDWRRLLWVVVPGGIAPALVVFAWRHLEAVGRAVMIAAGLYFALFYVQAHIMIHHLAPAMLLPIVAWWRLDSAGTGGLARWRVPVSAVSGFVALWMSLPLHAAPVVAARTIGSFVDDRAGGYEDLEPLALRRNQLLTGAFPPDYQPEVPATYGGSPLAWSYYAHREPRSAEAANYILVPSGEPGPAGSLLCASNEAGSLYIRSPDQWRSHRSLHPPTPAGSPLYWTQRGILFRSVPMHGGPWIMDVPAWLRWARVDVDALFRLLGVVVQSPDSDKLSGCRGLIE